MPSVSKKQQKFMGIVRAIQKGEAPSSKFSKKARDVAKSMKGKDVKKYASTKHKDLPNKVKSENKLFENPAAIAAGVRAAMQRAKEKELSVGGGKKVKVSTALSNKSHPQHKKAKGIIDKIKDKAKAMLSKAKKKKSEPKKQSKSDTNFYARQFGGKTESVYEAQKTSVSKSELSKAIKQIRGKEKGFHKPIDITLIMKVSQELNVMPSIIYKSMIKYKVGTEYIKGVRFEGLGGKSVNEAMSESQRFKVYNSLKRGDIVSIKYDSSIQKGSKYIPYVVTKGKTKLMKGKIERIILKSPKNPRFKAYLYNRDGDVSLALGDMAASIVDMKKGKVKESVYESVYKFRGMTKTDMDEFDAQLSRDNVKGTPDFNKMTYTIHSPKKSVYLDYYIKTKYKKFKPKRIREGFGGELKGSDKKKFEKARKENAEQLGYKLTGKSDVNESVNERMDKRQAGEMLKQLGGNRFIAMTGAKNFAVGPKGAGFKIGKNAKNVNYVRIDLDKGKDLYDMYFNFVSVRGVKLKSKVKGVYADQLQKMFTKHTGMYTSL